MKKKYNVKEDGTDFFGNKKYKVEEVKNNSGELGSIVVLALILSIYYFYQFIYKEILFFNNRKNKLIDTYLLIEKSNKYAVISSLFHIIGGFILYVIVWHNVTNHNAVVKIYMFSILIPMLIGYIIKIFQTIKSMFIK